MRHSSERTVLAPREGVVVSTRCTIRAHPAPIVAREHNKGLRHENRTSDFSEHTMT
jgi:hypothetical protein